MKRHLVTLALSLIGGFVGASLYASPAAQAGPREGLWVPGPDGRDRIQVATYESGGERGLPLVGLFDNRSQLRLLLRLAGANEAPVLVFKDRSGRDRMVFGLGMSGEEEPFLATIDRRGKKTMVFGNY